MLSAILIVAASLLMVSNVPYAHFGQIIWPNLPRPVKLLLFILIAILTIFAISHKSYRPSFVWFCVTITLVYLVYGIHSINRLKCKPSEYDKP